MQALEYVQNNIRALQLLRNNRTFSQIAKKSILPVIQFQVKNMIYVFRSLFSPPFFFMCHEEIFSFMQIFKF